MRLRLGFIVLALTTGVLMLLLAGKALASTYWWELWYTPGGAVPAWVVETGSGDSSEEVLSECFQAFPRHGCQLLNSRRYQNPLAPQKDYQESDSEGSKCWCATGGPTTASRAN